MFRLWVNFDLNVRADTGWKNFFAFGKGDFCRGHAQHAPVAEWIILPRRRQPGRQPANHNAAILRPQRTHEYLRTAARLPVHK